MSFLIQFTYHQLPEDYDPPPHMGDFETGDFVILQKELDEKKSSGCSRDTPVYLITREFREPTGLRRFYELENEQTKIKLKVFKETQELGLVSGRKKGPEEGSGEGG